MHFVASCCAKSYLCTIKLNIIHQTSKNPAENSSKNMTKHLMTNESGIGKGAVLLLNADDLTIQWCGQATPSHLNLLTRIRIALGYIRSKGQFPIFSRLSWRLIKAVISRWKSPQVLPLSGKPFDTTGLSFEKEWTSFNATGCADPHTLHGTEDTIEASRSSSD